MLLRLETDADRFDLVDENGNVIESDISKVKSGKIRYTSSETLGTVLLALYKNDVLLEISTNGFINVGQLTTGSDYRIMAAVWDFESLKPIVPCREIFN